MTKASLRQEFLAKRKSLKADDIINRSQLIAQRFINFLSTDQQAGKTRLIHVFLPIERQNEVDTWPLIRSIWAQFPEVQLAASITNTAEKQLTHYLFYPTTVLQNNRWEIPEPIPDEQLLIESSQPDIVLVPLLVFDRRGHRIGYGGGYYDRFLADCRPDCLKIGLSLFDPVEKISDIEITDIPLNICMTPSTYYSFD